MNGEELFLEIQDYLETVLETFSGIRVESKIGWATDVESSIIKKVARDHTDKRCIELRVSYPVVNKIYSFSEFSESNKKLIQLDSEIVSILRRIISFDIEHSIKKHTNMSDLVYTIRCLIPQEFDSESAKNITRRNREEYFKNILGTPPDDFYAQQIGVVGVNRVRSDTKSGLRWHFEIQNRGNLTLFHISHVMMLRSMELLSTHDTRYEMDKIIKKEENNPHIKIERNKNWPLYFIISDR